MLNVSKISYIYDMELSVDGPLLLLFKNIVPTHHMGGGGRGG